MDDCIILYFISLGDLNLQNGSALKAVCSETVQKISDQWCTDTAAVSIY